MTSSERSELKEIIERQIDEISQELSTLKELTRRRSSSSADANRLPVFQIPADSLFP